MANIDSIDEIKRLDEENILQNMQEFPEQIQRCWKDWQNIPFPTRFIQAKSILICGMGGSAIGAGLVAGLCPDAKIPIIIWRDYDIPGWVNKDTLVIASSYSGNTEETISSLRKASEKTDKIITLSTGGKIASLATNYRALHYKIDYGSQPRAALGYSFTSLLAIFSKLDLIEINDEDIREAIVLLRGLQKKIDAGVSSSYNNAKILAQKLEGFIPIVYGSGILSEVARRWKGQFNENSKTASYNEILPELNHNSLVGLEFPKDLRAKLFVIILQSKFDHPRNILRQNITLQILQKSRINCDSILMQPSPTSLSELLQTSYFGDYVSYYLAILNDIAPNPVEIISFLKDKLAEHSMEVR